jgi:hypothetical protein
MLRRFNARPLGQALRDALASRVSVLQEFPWPTVPRSWRASRVAMSSSYLFVDFLSGNVGHARSACPRARVGAARQEKFGHFDVSWDYKIGETIHCCENHGHEPNTDPNGLWSGPSATSLERNPSGRAARPVGASGCIVESTSQGSALGCSISARWACKRLLSSRAQAGGHSERLRC